MYDTAELRMLEKDWKDLGTKALPRRNENPPHFRLPSPLFYTKTRGPSRPIPRQIRPLSPSQSPRPQTRATPKLLPLIQVGAPFSTGLLTKAQLVETRSASWY